MIILRTRKDSFMKRIYKRYLRKLFQLFYYTFIKGIIQQLWIYHELGRAVQPKISENFDLSFVTFHWGFLLILVLLQFWVWVISNYTKRHSWKTIAHASLSTQSARKYRLEQHIPNKTLDFAVLRGKISVSVQVWNCCVQEICLSIHTGRSFAKVWSLSGLPKSYMR